MSLLEILVIAIGALFAAAGVSLYRMVAGMVDSLTEWRIDQVAHDHAQEIINELELEVEQQQLELEDALGENENLRMQAAADERERTALVSTVEGLRVQTDALSQQLVECRQDMQNNADEAATEVAVQTEATKRLRELLASADLMSMEKSGKAIAEIRQAHD